MTSLTLGSSVSKIGVEVFYECDKLSSIVLMSSRPPLIFRDTFPKDIVFNSTVRVPSGSLGSYKSNEEWGKFLYLE